MTSYSDYHKKYYQQNKARILARQKEYRANNRATINVLAQLKRLELTEEERA